MAAAPFSSPSLTSPPASDTAQVEKSVFETTPSVPSLIAMFAAAGFFLCFLLIGGWAITQSVVGGTVMLSFGIAVLFVSSMRFPRRYVVYWDRLDIRLLWTTWHVGLQEITAVEPSPWWRFLFFRGAAFGGLAGAVLLRSRAKAPWYVFATGPDILIDCRRRIEFVALLESLRQAAPQRPSAVLQTRVLYAQSHDGRS